MAQIICFDVYPNKNSVNKMRRVLVDRHGFEEKTNSRGTYFYIEVSNLDAAHMKLILNLHNYKYKSYDKRYSRSTSYRKSFFEVNKGPYRCVYCGKKLKSEDLEVDHLIPVSQTKNNIFARTMLHLSGVPNVNHVRNLVPSCSRCNRKKSDKMGLWVLRGVLGRNNWVWIVRNIIVSIIIMLAIIIFLTVVDLSWILDISWLADFSWFTKIFN